MSHTNVTRAPTGQKPSSSAVRVRARSEIGLQTDVWRKFWTTQSKHRKSLIETSVDKEMKKF